VHLAFLGNPEIESGKLGCPSRNEESRPRFDLCAAPPYTSIYPGPRLARRRHFRWPGARSSDDMCHAGLLPQWPIQAGYDSWPNCAPYNASGKSRSEKCDHATALAGCWISPRRLQMRSFIRRECRSPSDDVRRFDLEPRFTCKICGHRGANVSPLLIEKTLASRGKQPTRYQASTSGSATVSLFLECP
jgi:hypothetical protein